MAKGGFLAWEHAHWKILGYVAAFFNPLPTGLLAGYFLYKDKHTKKTGVNVLTVSILLSILFALALAKRLGY